MKPVQRSNKGSRCTASIGKKKEKIRDVREGEAASLEKDLLLSESRNGTRSTVHLGKRKAGREPQGFGRLNKIKPPDQTREHFTLFLIENCWFAEDAYNRNH